MSENGKRKESKSGGHIILFTSGSVNSIATSLIYIIIISLKPLVDFFCWHVLVDVAYSLCPSYVNAQWDFPTISTHSTYIYKRRVGRTMSFPHCRSPFQPSPHISTWGGGDNGEISMIFFLSLPELYPMR